jgi:hypothetical protein
MPVFEVRVNVGYNHNQFLTFNCCPVEMLTPGTVTCRCCFARILHLRQWEGKFFPSSTTNVSMTTMQQEH